MNYLQVLCLLIFSTISFAQLSDDIPFIDPISDEELNAGDRMLSNIERLKADTEFSINSLAAPVGLSQAAPLALTAAGDSRKRPGTEGGYYTLNGNCDIVIHGYEKQALYSNATYEWHASASYLLPVSNIGYLTYGNITLCDVPALESGTDYSEFIYNVQINGFSSAFEYRLELHNGQVTLWAKLPGGDSGNTAPEPCVIACCAVASLLATDRRRKA